MAAETPPPPPAGTGDGTAGADGAAPAAPAAPPALPDAGGAADSMPDDGRITVHVRTLTGKRRAIRLARDATVGALREAIAAHLNGPPPTQQRLVFRRARVLDTDDLSLVTSFSMQESSDANPVYVLIYLPSCHAPDMRKEVLTGPFPGWCRTGSGAKPREGLPGWVGDVCEALASDTGVRFVRPVSARTQLAAEADDGDAVDDGAAGEGAEVDSSAGAGAGTGDGGDRAADGDATGELPDDVRRTAFPELLAVVKHGGARRPRMKRLCKEVKDLGSMVIEGFDDVRVDTLSSPVLTTDSEFMRCWERTGADALEKLQVDVFNPEEEVAERRPRGASLMLVVTATVEVSPPPTCPFGGQRHFFLVCFPSDYPFHPYVVVALSPLLHPGLRHVVTNVGELGKALADFSRDRVVALMRPGEVELEYCGKGAEKWSPALTLVDVMGAVSAMLRDPTRYCGEGKMCATCFGVAKLAGTDPERFMAMARELGLETSSRTRLVVMLARGPDQRAAGADTAGPASAAAAQASATSDDDGVAAAARRRRLVRSLPAPVLRYVYALVGGRAFARSTPAGTWSA